MNTALLSALNVSMTTIGEIGTSVEDPEVMIDVLNPKGLIEKLKYLGLSPRIDDLDGKKIAFMHNNKAGSKNLYTVLEELFHKKYPTATIVHGYETGPINPPRDPKMYDKAAAECDAFIFAMGD